MKLIKFTIISIAMMLCSTVGYSQGVAINDDGTDANSSAMLDVKSNAGDKGFLLPRMTESQKNAISTPAVSLLVYQTDGEAGFYFYTGGSWDALDGEMNRYTTVAEAESASGTDNVLCFVVENETYYRYEETGSSYIDDNQYTLSTNEGGNTRWIGMAGQYNLGDVSLQEINHLDATSGSATITELNKIYYIAADASTTTITIPDASANNEGWFLRLYKKSGNGTVNIQTVSGQDIDGSTISSIIKIGKGFYIKSDNAVEWLKIQDSRTYIPEVVNTSVDYDETDDWSFDFLVVDTEPGDVNVTLPSDISNFPEGFSRMFFNTGSNRVFVIPNGNVIDGSSETRVIAPNGYLEFQKIDGQAKIVREKNLTIKKDVQDIDNLECWLDASQLSGTDGSSLTTWNDLSGNGNSFTDVNAPTLQTAEQNGKNVVRFDGTDDVMTAGDIELHNNTRGLTMIAVVKATYAKRMAILSKYRTTGNNREFAFGNKDNFLFEDLDWGSATGTVLNMGLDKFEIVEYVWEPGKAFELYINGVLMTTANEIVNDISAGIANLKLGGGDCETVGFWQGDMAEIMIYSDAVSSTEREALRDNLAVKWDVDEIIIANGGAKYWQRDGNINTISPDVANDNLDIGTGTFTGNMTVTDLFNAPVSSAAPASPQAGTIYYDSSDNKLKVYNGTTWDNLN